MRLVEALVYLARRRGRQSPLRVRRHRFQMPLRFPMPDLPPADRTPRLDPPPPAARFSRWPTQGRISSQYGMRFHPIQKKHKLHGGVDIAAPEGTPVWATSAGVVSFAGVQRGYGRTVIINHPGGLQTLYAHLSVIGVRVRQPVIPGQVIGAVGQTGAATGPHLHYEKRQGGKAINPGIG